MKFRFPSFPVRWIAAWVSLLLGLSWIPTSRAGGLPPLQAWQNLSSTWGASLSGADSSYAEGDTIDHRFVINFTAGTSHTVQLKLDFTSGDGRSRFLDAFATRTLPEATVLSGLESTGAAVEVNFPDDPNVPGDQSLGKLRIYNATVTSVGSYTVSDGLKILPVNIVVAPGSGAKTVVFSYSVHLARAADAPSGIGAAAYTGASRKAYARVDFGTAWATTIGPDAINSKTDLSLTQEAGPTPVAVGSELTYTLKVRNLGAVSAGSVVLTDTAPAGAIISASQGTVNGGTVNLGTIAGGQTATVTVKLTAPCGPVSNSAVVTTTTAETTTDNNSSSLTVTPVDTTPPTIAGVPTEPVIAFAPPTRCGASVVLPTVGVTDSCGATLTASRSDGQEVTAEFPIGVTRVTYIAADAAGNSATASHDVLVLPLNLAWPVATRLLLPEPDPNTGLSATAIEECIALESQSRWYKFRVRPGSRLLVTLENLPENYDLVLYKDIQKTYDQLTQVQGPADLTQLNAEFAADAFSADAFSSEVFAGAAFSGAAFSNENFAGAAWSGAAFSGAAFSGAAWSPDVYAPDTYFGAAFSGAAFSGAAWSGAAWSPDAVAGAAFSGAAWSGAAWSGAAWSGAAWSGAAFSGAAFSTEAASGAAWSGAAFSGAAFSDAQLRSIVGVSGFPGVGNEVILANTWDADGDFYIRVRGRNGAHAPGKFFKLGVQMLTGPCRNVLPLEALPAPTLNIPAAGSIKTLIVTDIGRIGQLSGTPADAEALRSRLTQFAGRPEIAGWILDAGQDARVAAANAQADASTGCVSAKNIVATAIRNLILDFRGVHPEIENIVLVGNDAVIPFFRQPDQGLLANENNYVPPVLTTSASEASLKLGYYLTQDHYAAACQVALKVGTVPLPDLGIGRLVETPAEIANVLAAYESAGGMALVPTKPLVTGYDFLADAAEAIGNEFRIGTGQPVDTLIQPAGQLPKDGWTAADLRAKLLGSRHDLVFLGGHFSAASALAADYLTRMTAAEVAASPVDLLNAVIVSAGCHSGYNIVGSDGVPSVTPEPDWAQAFARKGASLVAGTGYQYGDTDIIEYSERLYLNFARELRGGTGPVTLGQALARAKALYLAETPVIRGIHEKALLQGTLFGLPMLAVDLPQGRGPLPADTSVITALSPAPLPGQTFNLQQASLTIVPTLTEFTSELQDIAGAGTVTATYFAGGNGVVANPAEPLFPLEVRNVTVPGQVLRGVGFRGATYAEEDDLRPLTSAAATELSGVHTPFLTDNYFPIRFWNVNYFDALCTKAGTAEEATRLFVTPAQYLSKSTGSEVGTFRKFTGIDFRLYYNDNTTTYTVTGPGSFPSVTPSLAGPPSITKVSDAVSTADPSAQSVRFRIRVVGNPFAGMQEVWVTYTGVRGATGFHGRWQSLNLTQPDPENDSTLWEGVLPTGSVAPGALRYVVQAANGLGLVTLDTRLGAFYTPGGVEFTPTQASTLTITPPDPALAAYSTSVRFEARLRATDGGTPLAGKTVSFAIGTQEAHATTDAEGRASVDIPMLGFPGAYDIRASFDGDDVYRPSADAKPFQVVQQATALDLAPTGTIYVEAGARAAFVATLTAGGAALPERTVFFVFKPYVLDAQGQPVLDADGKPTFGPTSYNFPVITDFAGRAAFESLPRNAIPDGTYDFSVYFGSGIPGQPIDAFDPRYLPSTTAGRLEFKTTTVVVNDPVVAIQFPSDTRVGTSIDGAGNCTANLDLVTTASSSIAATISVKYYVGTTEIAMPYAFPVGITTVTAKAMVGDNIARSATIQVTVVDDEPPAILCPQALVVGSNSGCGYVGGIGRPAVSDNCTGPLSVTSDAPAAFPPGDTVVTWTVRDAAGLTATCVQKVTVVDRTAPTAKCKAATATRDPATGYLIVRAAEIDGGSTDNCGIVSREIGKGTLAANGTGFGPVVSFESRQCSPGSSQWVTLRVTDAAGNRSVCSVQVSFPDTEAPEGRVYSNPGQLSPPNHKLKAVQLSVKVEDANPKQVRCRILSVSSDEPIDGLGDGDQSPDWVFDSGPNPIWTVATKPSYSVKESVRSASYGWSAPGVTQLPLQLRAERSGKGNGRVYTITVELMDAAGNVGTAATKVEVPR